MAPSPIFKSLVCLAGIGWGALGWGMLGLAQTKPAYVTAAEAKAALDKCWNTLAGSLKINEASPVTTQASDQVMTKSELVVQLNSIMLRVQPRFKRTDKPYSVNVKALRKDSDRAVLIPLAQRGFVAMYGPVATGKNRGLTPKEFGDAIGVFMVRVADLAHLPSRSYSPRLMNPGR